MGKVRIIGGLYRSRILKFKDGVDGLRPTPDAIREKLFNWLGQDLSGKKCLDLFAGSGALGFEAVSRNATAVTMVESDKIVFGYLQENEKLLQSDNVMLINTSAIEYLKNSKDKFDLIFLDPPYASELLKQSLEVVKSKVGDKSILNTNGVMYLEYHTKPDLSGFQIIKESASKVVNCALVSIHPVIPS